MNLHANPVCEISAKEKAVRMGGFICFNFRPHEFANLLPFYDMWDV